MICFSILSFYFIYKTYCIVSKYIKIGEKKKVCVCVFLCAYACVRTSASPLKIMRCVCVCACQTEGCVL